MTKPIILVTGATGKTGVPVVRQLLERDYPVRAFVHKIDYRSQQLIELGAERLESFIRRHINIFGDQREIAESAV